MDWETILGVALVILPLEIAIGVLVVAPVVVRQIQKRLPKLLASLVEDPETGKLMKESVGKMLPPAVSRFMQGKPPTVRDLAGMAITMAMQRMGQFMAIQQEAVQAAQGAQQSGVSFGAQVQYLPPSPP